MKFNIYNYANEPTEVDTGDKEIRYIVVTVISGDEIIYIIYENETIEHYRSDYSAMVFYDGDYLVPKERIQEWIDLEKTARKEISYYRLEVFEE
nr:MAG TPA: hypothetical protein [Caudoviricetes sp.]